MKSAISTLIGSTLLATTFVGFSTAGAQALDCGLSDITLEGIDYTVCDGQFSGNDVGNKGTLEDDLNSGTVFGSYGFSSDWSLSYETGGGGGSNPYNFSTDNGQTSGDWSLGGDLSGLFGDDLMATFAVSFKSSTGYSVYLFEDFEISQSQLDSGTLTGSFTTDGVSVNNKGNAQGLSHGSLWVYDGEDDFTPPIDIPEPSMALALGLLGAGMFGMKKKYQK